jgi:integrase
LGIKGVSLHSYRYAWAERAKTAGYPERYAQVNLGHNSRAMTRAYSHNAPVEMPALSEYERQQKAIIGNRNTKPAAQAVTT